MSAPQFDAAALRVLGALVEKELTTPEYYPLTLNALTAACNQKTNRDPVVTLDEIEVGRALETLRLAAFAHQTTGGRVIRYNHNLVGRLHLDEAQTAVLAELLLRGPQTPGELRARAERMHHFDDLAGVEDALARLATGDPSLVAELPRRPGQKETRYQHLLGDPTANAAAADRATSAATTATTGGAAPAGQRLAELKAEMAELREQMRELRAEVRAAWKELRSLTMEPDPE